MSKKYSLESSPLKMDLKIDLTMFCDNVKTNFEIIWNMFNKQSEQFQLLKTQVQAHEQTLQQKQRKYSRSSNRKMSKNFSLNLSQISALPDPNQKQQIINPQNNTQNNPQQPNIGLINQPKQLSQQKQIKDQDPSQQANKTEQKESPNQNQLMKLMENKIYEMNQRLQRLQLTTIKQTGNFTKKLGQIYNELQKNTEAFNKKQGQLKKLQHYIEKFRGQLSEYKLKKQSKLMKMASLNTNSNGSGNQFNQIIINKIQQISNTLSQLLLKEQFDDFRSQLKPLLGKLQRKINDAVTNQQFNGLVSILSRKKSDINVNSPGKITKQNNKDKKSLQQITLNQDGIDPIVQFRILALQNQLKQLQQQAIQAKQLNQNKYEKLSDKNRQHHEKIQQILKQNGRFQQKIKQYENFMKDMNQSYNQKIKQIINQIVETQESAQKLNNQIKFYNYTKSDTNVSAGPTSHSSQQLIQGGKIADLQNQVSSLKKKVNKLTLKLQSIKQEILTVRQDFSREFDAVKLTLEKKCDWESLKKGMHYFEQRVKQISNYVQNLERNISQPEENGESTAAKKGWTCLCCDKDIKQYEGKLGQAKFTSIFPSRYQSPRIGGYYKQKQTDKEYKQVFLKHNRRLSQNNKSKQDMVL